ncbi:MAG: metallophosphoesterase [Verrucomicrobiae bacterium]|nr:metallophosphoesterase [Verrucomicrobiae bacterium]
MTMKLSCVFVALLCPHPVQAVIVAGRVFLDANTNGTFDPGEKPVAGCIVSDERTLTHSNAEGRYQLVLGKPPAVVFVVNPSGTWPAGRWWQYVCADATVDFALRAEDQSAPLYFVHGTDPHIQPKAVPMYRRYVEHVNSLPVPVKFVVHTGDLVVDAERRTLQQASELFSLYEEESSRLKPALRNLMGNHDVAGVSNPKVKEDEPGYGKALYRQRLGPATYAFRYGPYHFIALDGNTINQRSVSYALTKESADWAIAYLAEAKRHEPIILLIHEPMFPETDGVRQPDPTKTRPHEARLRTALRGKTLLMTLAGHTHGRTETTWAGAPHILGGAISYAWHGILPYPTTPRAYVLFRLEANREEHVWLDWAEERSIDVVTPAFTNLVHGHQKITGAVADFGANTSAVDCILNGQRAAAKLFRRGHLATTFETVLDTAELFDGTYDLLVTARVGDKTYTEHHPLVVVNRKPAPFTAAGHARLSFRIEGKPPPEIKATCNGHRLAVGPASGPEFHCDVPAEHLRRLNEIVIEARMPAVVRNVSLQYAGRRLRDVRFAPLARRQANPSVVSYIDLSYAPEGAPF